ncbi:AraC family transcriptional regulator [Sphingomonas sp.]|uniref:AraC family transcriptional regulator n=1 Tax=Sphingomonas sp. TaxID=28214 RepID=UPI003F726AD1
MRMQDPSLSHRRPRFGWRCGTFSPSRRQIRSTRLPYMAIGLLAASSESIARAAAWARPRLGENISVNDIAVAVGQSPRTFSRRVAAATGMSPVRFL